MASNNSNVKKRRSSQSDDEQQTNKKPRLQDFGNATAGPSHSNQLSSISSSSPLANSINIEWSRAGTKRARSKSIEVDERNVKARMTVDLSSSNPEPTTFLMGVMAKELDVIGKMLSPAGASSSTVGGSPSSSHSLSSSSTASSSPPSSPDYFDRLVIRGNEMLERIREDPDLMKYL